MKKSSNQLEYRECEARGLEKVIAFLWAIAAVFVVALLVFFQKRMDYACKRVFLVSNMALLAFGVGILGIFTYSCHSHISRTAEKERRFNPNKSIAVASIVLFFLQAYIFWNIYFLSDWDVGVISFTGLELIKGNEYTSPYYSNYPNNLSILWILTGLLRLNELLGCSAEPFYFVILVQCALSCLAGFLLFAVVKDLTNLTCGYFSWGIYVLHIALSPWLAIPYTDAMGLITPIAMLWMYQLTQKQKSNWWLWIAIGGIGFFGYKVKPQCVIVLIAIVITEGLKLIHSSRGSCLRIMKNLALMLTAGCLALSLCNNVLFASIDVPVDSEKEIGATHFIMMGLNTESGGVYSSEDVQFSQSFATKQERTAGNIAVIKERLREMGLLGLMEHIVKKTLVNFGDGTYAWGVEGIFYKTLFEERNTAASPFLRSIYYSYEGNFLYFATVENGIWVTMLFCSIGCVFYFQNKKRTSLCVESVVILTLIGAAAFQTIFEARNRYFFVNAPLFIIAAVIGWCGFCEKAKAIICKARSGNEKGVQTYE